MKQPENTNQNDDTAVRNRMMSMMFLLFDAQPEMPCSETICSKLNEKGYQVNAEWKANEKNMRMFFLPEHTVDFDGAKGVPYQLLMLDQARQKEHGSALDRTQFWGASNGIELLDSCGFEVMIGDFISAAHPPEVRAKILSDWLEIALDLFPACKGVWFEGSRNVLTAEALRSNPYEGNDRIFLGMVNARFFRVGGTDDMVVDTLGMHVFGLPDVQMHFRGLNPNHAIRLALDIAMYQFANDCPIKDNETVDGFDAEGEPGGRWKCQYEMALIEPKRHLLDVNTGEFAAGNRTHASEEGEHQ